LFRRQPPARLSAQLAASPLTKSGYKKNFEKQGSC
jgi:hypothetical protein